MQGKSYVEIINERERAAKEVNDYLSCFDDVEILDSLVLDYDGENALFCLSQAIAVLSQADVAYFLNGYEKARGCLIEEMCCKKYGIHILRQSDVQTDKE